jgi:heme-degrading monooxygenase HmoA
VADGPERRAHGKRAGSPRREEQVRRGEQVGPVVLINVFTPKPGKLDAFIETQKAELERLSQEAAIQGWRGSRLHRAVDGKTAVMVTVFDTIDDHKHWVATHAFAEHLDRIRPLIERAEPGYYELVAEAGRI